MWLKMVSWWNAFVPTTLTMRLVHWKKVRPIPWQSFQHTTWEQIIQISRLTVMKQHSVSSIRQRCQRPYPIKKSDRNLVPVTYIISFKLVIIQLLQFFSFWYTKSLIAKIGFYVFATKVFLHHKPCEKVIFSIKHKKKCSQICEYKEYIVSLP